MSYAEAFSLYDKNSDYNASLNMVNELLIQEPNDAESVGYERSSVL